MTVGAVIVPDGVEEALADATGRTAVRRIVDSAWAGGAMPIVVVAADPDDRIAATLQDLRPSSSTPGVPPESGPTAWELKRPRHWCMRPAPCCCGRAA